MRLYHFHTKTLGKDYEIIYNFYAKIWDFFKLFYNKFGLGCFIKNLYKHILLQWVVGGQGYRLVRFETFRNVNVNVNLMLTPKLVFDRFSF